MQRKTLFFGKGYTNLIPLPFLLDDDNWEDSKPKTEVFNTDEFSQNPSSVQGASTSDNKKHKCPYCNTEFKEHHSFKAHLLTHSQEKPYVCTHCQLCFRRLHTLKRHVKVHNGEKPHKCPKCNRLFANADGLAIHVEVSGVCGRRFGAAIIGDDDEMDEGFASAADSETDVRMDSHFRLDQ